ncbi:hypothetical protein [Pseudophaeobacter sp.]|uniref:hypothetical protein n=1 Tax=Pseudophaeobacter sp. TaxID=1971739 RepID=UPI00329975A6
MKRITATAIGIVLAAGLAIASPQSTATDLVTRYYATTSEADLAATWGDWHPGATHHIEIKTGIKDGDFAFSYAMFDWENLPDWTAEPEIMEAMKGYEETGRSDPNLTISAEGTDTIVTAQSKVAYVWDGYKGAMTQTDRFTIATTAGRAVIRDLTTLYDYR